MKTSEQKSVSYRAKPAPHYCKPPPENQKGGYRRIGYGADMRSALLLMGGGLGASRFAFSQQDV